MNGIGKLLINESPLTVLPTLAKLIGLQKAIIIQQIHYLCQQPKSGKFLPDGNKYIWNSYEDWIEDYFPFWSKGTLIKHFTALEDDDLILTEQPNKHKFDHTKYYRINYAKLLILLEQTDSAETTLSDGAESIPSDSAETAPPLNVQRLHSKTSNKETTTRRNEIPVNAEYAGRLEAMLEWMLIESKELRLPYEKEYPKAIEELWNAGFTDAELKKYFAGLVANPKINCITPNILLRNVKGFRNKSKNNTGPVEIDWAEVAESYG